MGKPQRVSAVHAEEVLAEGQRLRCLGLAWERATADGRVDADECRLLDGLIAGAIAGYRPVTRGAETADAVASLVELLSRRGITPWTARRFRELAADLARFDEEEDDVAAAA